MNSDPSSTIRIERTLRMLRRRGPIVLVCVLLAAASAYVFAKRQTPKYTAAASLLFSSNQLGTVASGLTPSQTPVTQSQQDTNVRLVQLGDIAARTAAQLGPNWSAAEVMGAVSAAADSDTSIVKVSGTARTAKLARTVANTYSDVFVAEQARKTQAQISSAQRLVAGQYKALTPRQRVQPPGLALANRAQSLAILTKLQSGDVSVVSRASSPTAQTSPKVSRDVALGAVIGLLIGIAIAFMLERLDQRIRDAKELEAVYQLPLLGAVPERQEYTVPRTLGYRKRSKTPAIFDEVFNLLRSYLPHFSVGRDLRSLLVVSAQPGEGKTTVSYNLAKSAAGLGARVLLIEGDLRRRTMIGAAVDEVGPGLSGVLIGEAQMEEATHSVEIGAREALNVLVAGEVPPPNPGELIESHAMESLLQRARAQYDLVVIDTAPLDMFADTVPLLSKVDGIVVVGRIGRTRRDTADQLRKRLTRLRVPVLGIVANGVRRTAPTAYGSGDSSYSARKVPSSNGTAVGLGARGATDAHDKRSTYNLYRSRRF